MQSLIRIRNNIPLQRYWPNKSSLPSRQNDAQYDKITRIAFVWMYSWANSGCETELEFLVSKFLFHRFLRSESVKVVFGSENVDKIFEFLRKSVEPWEDSFCFYLRKQTRHFDVCSNTAHEGTNNGMKYCGPRCYLT